MGLMRAGKNRVGHERHYSAACASLRRGKAPIWGPGRVFERQFWQEKKAMGRARRSFKLRLSPAGLDVLIDSHCHLIRVTRSEEHTSELQSLMRISYAVFCLKKKKKRKK